MATMAEKYKEKVQALDSKKEAMDYLYLLDDLSHTDQTESDTNITTSFYFKDDSELLIDTERYCYCPDETEIAPVAKWLDE